MTDEPTHTDGPAHDDADTPEGVLSPTDLGLDETVEEIEPGRYVVPTDERTDHSGRTQTGRIDENASTPPSADGEHTAVETSVSPAAYAATVTMRTPDGTDTTQIETNDVRELFDALLVWQVEQLASTTDPEKALSVLIRSSSLSLGQ